MSCFLAMFQAGGSVPAPSDSGWVAAEIYGDAPDTHNIALAIGGHDLVVLGIAVTLLVLSIFFLHQAAAVQKWASKNEEDLPPADAGLTLGWVGAIVVLAAWSSILGLHSALDPVSWAMTAVRYQPGALIAPMAIASLLPSAIAIYKFTMANAILQAGVTSRDRPEWSSRTSLLGVVFTVIQLAASLATLAMYVAWIGG